ncbi:MAG: ABC-F family ATP-binding cassette domain-containing protein [Verrucomicrobiota bacterium]
MLSISGVAKAYAGRILFEDVSLQVNRGDRIGLVGPNGAGKSTLFGLILDRESPDAGNIALQRGTSLGYLPQESMPPGNQTVLDLATSTTLDVIHTADGRDKTPAASPGNGAASAVADLHLDNLNAYELEPKAKKVLRGLGFRERDYERPCRELSGGWVMRAHLARLLVQEPDLLMLDEPTNHLDLEALLWFQDYLRHYSGAILLISHDREFLNRLVGSIVEIRQGRLWRYRGNYEEYVAQRDAQEEQLLAAYKNQQREIAQLMRFVERFRAKNTKAAQAQSKLKQIERMDKIEAPVSDEAEIDFRFPQPRRSGLRVITLKDIHQSYGRVPVYEGMHFEAERGQRIVLVGPNGSASPRCWRLLLGSCRFNRADASWGTTSSSDTSPSTAWKTSDWSEQSWRKPLTRPSASRSNSSGPCSAAFSFAATCSAGCGVERRRTRLALVKLLLDPPNLLLMDEPTTHLDMASIEALIAALEQYEGTLIFISPTFTSFALSPITWCMSGRNN